MDCMIPVLGKYTIKYTKYGYTIQISIRPQLQGISK